MAVRKNILNKIIIEYRINLVNYPYFKFLEIQDLDQQSKYPKRKIWIFNIYDNWIKQEYN